MLFNLFQKIEVEGILPKPFHKAIFTLIPKLDKDEKGKLHTSISHEQRCRNL